MKQVSEQRKQTKDNLLNELEKLMKFESGFDTRWFDFIKQRFLISQIGMYCVQNNISGKDLLSALKNMSFDEFFTLKSGFGSMKGAHKDFQFKTEWYDFKPDMEKNIIERLDANLPLKRTLSQRPAIPLPINFNPEKRSDKIPEANCTKEKFNEIKTQFNEIKTPTTSVKQTKDNLLDQFALAMQSEPQFDSRWFDLIKQRFLISQIGLYCVQNNISGKDLLCALKNMPFDEFFTLKSGLGSMKTAHKDFQYKTEWYDFKPDMEKNIRDIFKTNLPIKPALPPRKSAAKENTDTEQNPDESKSPNIISR